MAEHDRFLFVVFVEEGTVTEWKGFNFNEV